MPFSVSFKGQIHDLKWVRHGPQDVTRVYKAMLGDTVICYTYWMSRPKSWSVVVCHLPEFYNRGLDLVDGFKTREDAFIYALRAIGIWID